VPKTKVRFALSPKERSLILKHGYPFEEFEAALKAADGNADSVVFELDQFYFEHLLGEVARSANHAKSGRVEAELSDLYEYLQGEAEDHGLATL